MNYNFKTLVVPGEHVELARRLCAGLAGTPGEGMFGCPLSSDGEEPASHWASSGAIGVEFAGLLTDPEAMFAACQAAGLDATLEQCQDLLAESEIEDLDTEDVWTTFARLEVQVVQTGEV